MAIMAYRGMRNDQALREKENMRKLEVNSHTFFSEIDTSLVRLLINNLLIRHFPIPDMVIFDTCIVCQDSGNLIKTDNPSADLSPSRIDFCQEENV